MKCPALAVGGCSCSCTLYAAFPLLLPFDTVDGGFCVVCTTFWDELGVEWTTDELTELYLFADWGCVMLV